MDGQQPQPQTCTGCGGTGGHTVDTSHGGITRQNWERCTGCSGTGVKAAH